MDHYHMLGGNTALFEKAPPRAEVVLEVIGEDRYIFAEAFKPGAQWWYWEGQRGRRGLVGGMMSDYHCVATRQIRPRFVDAVKSLQADWDYQYGVSGSITLHTQAPCPTCGITGIHACMGLPTKELTAEEEAELRKRITSIWNNEPGKDAMIKPFQTCMVCGKPTADGMIHACTPRPRQDITQPAPAYIPPVELSKKVAPGGQFHSIFDNDRYGPRPWVRLNRAGRIKFCQSLMDRFEGMLVDVELDQTTGRIRFGESENGKALTVRGFMHSTNLMRLIDFGMETNRMVFVEDYCDGWLYGQVPVKE
ncbi:hypothetical protein AH156_20055 [Salmonella enterica subsp. enterica serovar Enteritidis]|nr:hypothetical protein [Salmonella enterica subsp. enterica serovar Enteritidis]